MLEGGRDPSDMDVFFGEEKSESGETCCWRKQSRDRVKAGGGFCAKMKMTGYVRAFNA